MKGRAQQQDENAPAAPAPAASGPTASATPPAGKGGKYRTPAPRVLVPVSTNVAETVSRAGLAAATACLPC